MRPSLSRRLSLAAVCLATTTVALGCGGSSSNVTPTGAPTPAPTPVPTPEPTPLPAESLGCGLPRVPNPSISCPRTSGSYQHIVEEALARLAAEHPELFDFDNRRGPLGYYINDHDAYYEGVLSHIRAQGACAIFDGEEIALKMTNEFSDQYKIMLSSGHVQTGDKVYRATCQPPAF
jgi:hypothetical protein